MLSRKDYLHGEPVETIYFGGGTPSLLTVEEIGGLLQLVRDSYEVILDPEITLEANPDTLSLEYLVSLRKLGVSRLSIGIQSFFDEDLKYLSRRHDAQHAQACLLWARTAGFDNVTIDLIYGLPTSDADQWSRNLDRFFATGFPHLSAYALTLEPNAILTKQIEMGKVLSVNEDDAVRDYEILCPKMAQHGFQHYEISNFCKPGMHSRHNTSYWFGVPYAGFGPSAHSYDGESRQWNVASVEQYVESGKWNPEGLTDRMGGKVESGKWKTENGTPKGSPTEREVKRRTENIAEGGSFCNTIRQCGEGTWKCDGVEYLTAEQRYDEYVMLRLRTMWGVDLSAMKQSLGERFSTYCEKNAQPLIEQGRLSRKGDVLYLTDQQMLFADGIAEELFW